MKLYLILDFYSDGYHLVHLSKEPANKEPPKINQSPNFCQIDVDSEDCLDGDMSACEKRLLERTRNRAEKDPAFAHLLLYSNPDNKLKFFPELNSVKRYQDHLKGNR